MPRSKRISWLNYPHLVIAESNSDTCLFSTESDYLSYLSQLRQLTRDRLLKVFAFCLSERELRLVVEPTRLILPRIIQKLHGQHSAYMNQKLARQGHLFKGRFKSLIFSQQNLLDVVRSVHLWPVRQGLLRRPELYPYSSHQAYVGSLLGPHSAYKATANRWDFLSQTEVLDQFSGELELKRRAFSRYVEQVALEPDGYGVDELVPGIGGNAKSAAILLDKAQMAKPINKKSSIKTLAERVSLLLNISLDYLCSTSKRQDLVMARRLLATASVLKAARSITEVADFLGRDKAQISRLVSQGMDLSDSNEAFAHMLDSLKAKGSGQD